MSKHINKITLFLSLICLILGIRTNWREYTFRKASTVAKATIISVDTKLQSGKAIANVDYVLTYKRDNLIDTLSYSTTEAYSLKEPLPSIEELKKNNFYIYYVPKIKSNETPFKDRVFISNNKVLENIFYSGWFSRMIFILILGYILSRSIYRKRV